MAQLFARPLLSTVAPLQGTVEPDITDLRRQLRAVYTDTTHALKVAATGRRFVADHYSPEAIALAAVGLVEDQVGITIR